MRWADRREEKERGQSEKWANGEPSLRPLLIPGRQPATPSIALSEMEKEERKGKVQKNKAEGDGNAGMYVRTERQ